jgi:hypothetical protein
MTTRYNTVVGAGWEGCWIDPQGSKNFGANARYLTEYNVAEAKKLFSAAGYPNGFSSKMYWPIRVYGSTFENAASVLALLGRRRPEDPVHALDYQQTTSPTFTTVTRAPAPRASTA